MKNAKNQEVSYITELFSYNKRTVNNPMVSNGSESKVEMIVRVKIPQ